MSETEKVSPTPPPQEARQALGPALPELPEGAIEATISINGTSTSALLIPDGEQELFALYDEEHPIVEIDPTSGEIRSVQPQKKLRIVEKRYQVILPPDLNEP